MLAGGGRQVSIGCELHRTQHCSAYDQHTETCPKSLHESFMDFVCLTRQP